MIHEDIARLLIHSENLTEIPRTGYVLEGVADAEKVSSHCFGVIFLVMLISKHIDGVDESKALKMAVIHDLPESVIGDLTPSASNFLDKKSIEKKVASDILPNHEDLLELFLEYQKNETADAKLVHDADKLQMMIRANRYKRQKKGDMDRFYGVKFHYSIFNDILSSFINLDGEKNIK